MLLLLSLWGTSAYAAFPTPTDLTTSSSSTDGTSYTTASITPPSNTLILAVVHSEIASGTPNTPTLAGNGLTWVAIGSNVTNQNRTTAFRARGTATVGTVVIDYAGQTMSDSAWSIVSVGGAATTGTNGSGAIVQFATATNSAVTSLTVTLAAFANAANATFGFFGINNNVSMVAGSGFTIVNQPGLSSSRAAIEWKIGNDTSVDMTWTSSTAAAVAVEVAPAAATGGGRSAPMFFN
jgi:hypothetical protein